jgi:hypothetical protein
MSLLKAVITNPQLVLQHRNIFLMSHMRANTSLFGHLMGSHPEVEGYYEMHQGYYSWRSLWRQKLRHFAKHDGKPGARYMFDKVLHDGHHVAPALLQRPSSHTILMLRTPEQSIRSLVVLYRQQLPHLPEAQAEGAAQYYIQRLETLARTAEQLGGRYFYLDAEALISQTDSTLAQLSQWLGLKSVIPSTYETFSHTGHGHAGDHSKRLKSGQVDRSRNDYSTIEVPEALMQQATEVYARCRQRLASGAQAQVVAAA